MNDTEKIMLAGGTGIVIGKVGGSLAWWVLGAATAVFIMNSAGTKSAVSKAYSAYKSRK